MWSLVLRFEIFVGAVFLCFISIFASQIGIDDGGSWGLRRITVLGIGIALLFLSLLLSFPKYNKSKYSRLINKIARYLNLLSFFCLLSFVLIETSLRITYTSPPIYSISTNWFGEVPKSGSSRLWAYEGFAITHYDSLGEIHTPFSEGDNILVLGDSITEGWQVRDENKYASIIENALQNEGISYNIRNFGKSGLTMADYVSRIPLYKKIYNPEIIILQLWKEDFIESFENNRSNYFIENDSGLTLIHKQEMNGDFVKSPLQKNFYPITLSYGSKRLKLFLAQDKNNNTQDTFNNDLAKLQMEQLLIACNGTKLIVWLVPPTPTLENNNIIFQGAEFIKFKEFFKQYPEIVVIDPSPDFARLVKEGHFPRGFSNSLNPGTGHLNQYGNEIVGELLAESIKNILR